MKRLFALMLALALVFSMTLSSLAAVADYGDEDDTPPPAVAGENTGPSSSTGGQTFVGGSARYPASYIPANFLATLSPVSVTDTGTTPTATITNSADAVKAAVLAAGGTQASADAAALATSTAMTRDQSASPTAAPAAPKIVYVTSDATLSAAAIAAIRDSGETYVFVTPFYTISISPKSITKPRDISLNLGLLSTASSLQIRPAMQGSFGLTMDIAMVVPSSVKLSAPRLFYVPDSGSAQDFGPVSMSGNIALFSISSASAYVIADRWTGSVAAPAGSTTVNVNPATGAAA